MNRLLLFFVVPVLSYAAGCDVAIGDWRWFNGGSVTLTAQKTVLLNGKPEGRWECSDPNRNTITVRWKVIYVDTMNIAGNRMTGKNQQGATVTAERKSAPGRK